MPERPGGTRPGLRPGDGDRPIAGNRPGDRPGRPGDRPDRPELRPGPDRPGPDNRPDRPWAGGGRWPGYNPIYNHYHLHQNWHYGTWRGWYGYPWAWAATGAALGWMWAPGTTYVYSNPYYVQPTTYVDPALSYAEPIAVPATAAEEPTEEYAEASEATPEEAAASKRLDRARAAFLRGDYKRALAEVEQAIRLVPDDPTLHEFRALCFFALKDYQQAAAALYAVLSRGPGWNWDTMIALYPSQNVYTAQLRALEAFVRQNPQDAAAPFVLAYQYLVLEDFEAAKYQLQQVVRLSPENKLAADLLRALDQAPPPGALDPSAAGEPRSS